jgi:parallel beta-helix repeat protein
MPVTYYFSNSGSDLKDGLSPDTPWQSLEKLNSIVLQPGDKVLFKCGDCFRGSVSVKNSGTPESHVLIGSFGEGEKPLLSGAEKVFSEDDESRIPLKFRIEKQVKGVFAGNEWLNIARYPSSGFFGIDDGDKVSLKDRELLIDGMNCAGATARIRAVNWQYEIAKVASHEGDTLFFEREMMYQCNKDYGYFLDNKLEFLNEPGEWYYDNEKALLYFIPPENARISEEGIETVIHDTGIKLCGSMHILISNIHFEKYHLAGILCETGTNNTTIEDCLFTYIHQDGISLESGCKKFEINNNRFSSIKGRAIACLDVEECSITENTIKDIGLFPGYGFDGVNSGTGIAVLKTELVYTLTEETLEKVSEKIPRDIIESIKPYTGLPFPDEKFLLSFLEEKLRAIQIKPWLEDIGLAVRNNLPGAGYDSRNNYVGHNQIENTGLHSIRLDGKVHLCEYNICKNSLLCMNDGSSIYSWAQNYDYSVGSTIRKNIIINAVGHVVATPDFHRFAHGIYIDNKCVGFSIEGNIITGTTWGILINDEAREHTISKNTVFDNEAGLALSEYFMPGTLYGCKAFDNVLFARKRSQRSLLIESRICNSFDPVITDRNFYASSYYTFPIIRLTFRDDHRVWEEFDLHSWQKETGMDKNSGYFAPPDPEARPRNSFIIINDSTTVRTFPIDNSIRDHFDIHGNQLGEEVTLDPFSAMIVLND